MVRTDRITPEMAKELAFNEQEREELKRARRQEITFDEDCPEVTPDKAVRFRRVNPKKTNSKRA